MSIICRQNFVRESSWILGRAQFQAFFSTFSRFNPICYVIKVISSIFVNFWINFGCLFPKLIKIKTCLWPLFKFSFEDLLITFKMIYNTSGSYVNNMFKKLIKLYKTFANFYATRCMWITHSYIKNFLIYKIRGKGLVRT